MVKFSQTAVLENNKKGKKLNNKLTLTKYNRLITIGKLSAFLINELYTPIDSINRFINLALQNTDDGAQSRQFLLESKEGIRRMSTLLNRLNKCTKKIEKQIFRILEEESV